MVSSACFTHPHNYHSYKKNDEEENEACQLLFNDESLLRQLFSGLSLLAERACSADGPMELPSEPFKLRLTMRLVEVASKCPLLGTLLLERPRRLDIIMNSIYTQWLREEEVAALPSARCDNSQTVCHHTLAPWCLSANTHKYKENECLICSWTIRWPRVFWDALQNGSLKVSLYCALDTLPSCLMDKAHHSLFHRPNDAAIGAEKWIKIIGHVTGVFFSHRESTDPEPIVEFQPLLANSSSVVGQTPVMLDFSLLPQSEVRAVAVVGERIQVIGLLEGVCGAMGTVFCSRRSHNTSFTVQIVLEVRAVCMAAPTSQFLRNQLIATPFSHSFFSLRPIFSGAHGVVEQLEAAALFQAKCSWESLAGAAASALANISGGFFRPGEEMTQSKGFCRTEALFEISKVFALPAEVWAAVGIVLTSATLHGGTVAASVVGPLDRLSALQSFLLELGSATNVVVPVVHGMEGGLLPLYSRVPASLTGLAVTAAFDGGRRVECVRGGLLNRAFRRVLFAPSLHSITPSALRAIQGVIEQHEHVVVREGGQRVVCEAAGAFIGITQAAMPVQHQHLFRFIERGDIVIPVFSFSNSSSSLPLHVLEEELEMVCGLLLAGNCGGEEQNEMMATDQARRYTSQWRTWCELFLFISVDEPVVPTVSDACAELLHVFFVVAKAVCGVAVDTSMMATLVKLTSAHALLRWNLHHTWGRGLISTATLPMCVCGVGSTELTCSTALIDAIVAIALCDISLNFIAGVSLVGKPSLFELMVDGDAFDVVCYAKQLHESLVSRMQGVSL